MPTLIHSRQSDPEAVTMDKTDATGGALRARSELEAMEAIADLLAQLPDAAARNRVLTWAGAIFHQAEPALFSTAPAPPLHVVRPVAFKDSNVTAQEDSGLSIGDLEDWFVTDKTPLPAARSPQAVKTQPVVSMIHGFVEDFQKLAKDWQEG
jgi:hypothetical protein